MYLFKYLGNLPALVQELSVEYQVSKSKLELPDTAPPAPPQPDSYSAMTWRFFNTVLIAIQIT